MEKRKGYMCKIDFDHELGEALGGNVIYPSIKDLKKHHPYKTCGIVEVEITLTTVVEPNTYGDYIDD